MICENCGTQNKDGVKFCRICGAKLNTDDCGLYDTEQLHNNRIKSHSHKWIVFVIACAVAVALGIIALTMIGQVNVNLNGNDHIDEAEAAKVSSLSIETTADVTTIPLTESESTTNEIPTQKTTDKKYYTVQFINYDGSLISRQTVEEGQAAEAPETPVKPSDEFFDYTFKGWMLDFSCVTNNMIIAPNFDAQLKSGDSR